MSTIVTRAGKGSPLTNAEVDANFINLNTDKIEASDSRTLTNKVLDSITNTVGADHIHFKIKATEAITKGNVLKVVGYNSGEDAIEVAKVSSSADIAVGLAHENLSSGSFGALINTGLLEGIDTSAFTVGTVLYPNTSGGLTSTKPTSGTYQAIAFVLRSHAVNGTVLIEATEPNTIWLPSQTGNSGKFLTTNGTTASWATMTAPNNGTLTLAVSGTGLSGSASFTADQAGNSTFTVASNATNANTASTIVARDASGNFSAGTISAALSGNASTATTLATARSINGVSFNGSADITVADSTKLPLSGGTMTGTITNSATSLIIGTAGGATRGYLYNDTSGIGFLTNAGSWAARLDIGTSNWYVWGNVTAYSDERVKKNWREYPSNFVEQLAEIKHGTYDRTDIELTQDGVSAQSLAKLLPYSAPLNSDDNYTVNYGGAALVSAVQLAKRVVEQAERIARLEATVAKLVD
jgi:hypothetical protein